MKLSRIRLIIILMSTALLGIVLVQVYWIRSAVEQKEQVFKFQVADALARTTEKLETHWIATMLDEQTDLFIGDSLFIVAQTAEMSAEMLSDTALASAFRVSDKARELEPSGSYLSDMNSPGGMPGRPTMILEPLEMGRNMTVDPAGKSDELIPAILKEIDKQFRVNANQLDAVMRKMMVEMMTRGMEPEKKVDTTYLTQTLGLELRNKGIETRFDYGVLLDGEILVTPLEKENHSQLISTAYTANLFPNNLFAGNDQLLVMFPDQRNYLLSSMWLLLLGSILFTTVIVFVFSYSIHIIFRQKKLSEIKNDFINNMTHEFKTPIATISLAVDAINNPAVISDQQRVKQYTGIIRDENKRMNSQVEKVLQAALLDKRELNLKMDAVNLHEVITHAVENISLMVEEQQGSISTRLEAIQFVVNGDRVHLSNVIYNLLDNAVKYAQQAPLIEVSTRSSGGKLFIAVRDNGIGMNNEQQKMIFEKFYRVPTGNVHNIKGFGLGLTYVKTVVEAHGGSIDVKSQLGAGSTFTIQLFVN